MINKISILLFVLFLNCIVAVSQKNVLQIETVKIKYGEQNKSSIKGAIIQIYVPNIENIETLFISIGYIDSISSKVKNMGYLIKKEKDRFFIECIIDTSVVKSFLKNNRLEVFIDLSNPEINKVNYCLINYFDLNKGYSKDYIWDDF